MGKARCASTWLCAFNAMKRIFKFLLVLVMASTAISCEKDSPDEEMHVDFDRAALLADLAVHIHGSYETYHTELSDLQTAVIDFQANPGVGLAELQALRTLWRNTLLAWQGAAPFAFGPAEDVALEASTNIYPVTVADIEDNIYTGSYNLDAAVNISAIGLQAVDYMLFGLAGTDAEIVDLYTTDGLADNRLQYLVDLVEHMHGKATTVLGHWQPGAQYRNEFIANDGTSQGSSLGLFLNAFNKSWEASTRANKLGLPSGAMTFSMTPIPEIVEAYYENNNSVAYLRRSVEEFQKIFISGDEAALGLDNYLVAIGAQHGGEPLDQVIKDQIDEALLAIDNLQDPLADFVVNDQQTALDTYAEMQELVVLWKVDMMSALGVLIIYQDNDGD